MAVKNLNLPSFPCFDVTEVTTIATRWSKYKKKSTLLCSAVGVTDNKQKLSMFLTYLGDEAYDIYENLITPGDKTFEEVIIVLDTYFKHKSNISYETYVFRQLKQNTEETLNQFYLRLKEQAAKCDFTNIDREIKQQIEVHATNGKLRRYVSRKG